MKLSISIFALLFLCFTIHAHRPESPPPLKPTGTMLKACALAVHKDFCIQTLMSDPNCFQADHNGLALIALRLASMNASDISESIKILFSDAKMTEPGLQQGLFDCLDQYVDAAQQLDDAMASIMAKAYKDVETWVKVAIADAQTCEASFSTGRSVLTHKNRVFMQMCSVALSINKLAASGH